MNSFFQTCRHISIWLCSQFFEYCNFFWRKKRHLQTHFTSSFLGYLKFSSSATITFLLLWLLFSEISQSVAFQFKPVLRIVMKTHRQRYITRKLWNFIMDFDYFIFELLDTRWSTRLWLSLGLTFKLIRLFGVRSNICIRSLELN